MDNILIVDDSIMNHKMLTNILSDEYNVLCANGAKQMFEILETSKPKLILLDVIMPELDGFEVIEKLKASDEYGKIPVIFITGLNDEKSEAKGLELGAIDYITKPFKAEVVRARVRSYVQLYEFVRKAEVSGQRDGLTGLYNKKTTEELIKAYLVKHIGDKNGALMIIDIDNFKTINDTFGHLYGDVVLTQFAITLKEVFQKSDIIGRVGGDEFFVFLKNYKELAVLTERAKTLCTMLRKTYEQDGQSVTVSASIGIATTENTSDFETIYKQADIALYETKARGKNGFTFYTGNETGVYKSQRTQIESSKKATDDISENIKNFKDDIKEHVLNIGGESSVADHTIQSILQLVSNQFGFNAAYMSKIDYEGGKIRCTYNWKSASPQAKPFCVNVTLSQITEMLSHFEGDAIEVVPVKDGMHIFSPAKTEAKSVIVFGLKSQSVLVGYFAFESSQEWDKVNPRAVDTVYDMCQQLTTVVMYQFLTENILKDKQNMIAALNGLNNAVYVASKDSINPLFANTAARETKMPFHGMGCFRRKKDGKPSCTDCPIIGAIENGGTYDDDRHYAKEIEWSQGSKAYLIKVKNKKA